MTREQLEAEIARVEKALAELSDDHYPQIAVRYPIGGILPSVLWCSQQLGALGLRFVEVSRYPHRQGSTFRGLLVDSIPGKAFPPDWDLLDIPTLQGRAKSWSHRELNRAYREMSKQFEQSSIQKMAG